MRRGIALLVWLGLGLSGGSLCSTACSGPQFCTFIGCSDSEALELTAPVATVSDTDISACLEQRCWRGHIAASDLFPSSLGGTIQLQADSVDPAGALEATCTTNTYDEPNVTLQCTWSMSTVGQLQSGDTLTITLTDSTGTAVLSQTGTVTSFTEQYPNGKDCDKVGCRVALVKANAAR